MASVSEDYRKKASIDTVQFYAELGALPSQFHHTGPFHDGQGRKKVDFPGEQITGEPLIYASMGTILNGRVDVFRTIYRNNARTLQNAIAEANGLSVAADLVEQSLGLRKPSKRSTATAGKSVTGATRADRKLPLHAVPRNSITYPDHPSLRILFQCGNGHEKQHETAEKNESCHLIPQNNSTLGLARLLEAR